MYKYFCILLFTFLLFQGVNAQEKQYGIIGGANYSTIIGDFTDSDFIDSQRRLSFHLGVVGNYELAEKWTFSPRLLYSSQGTRREIDVQNFDPLNPIVSTGLKISRRTSYITIPLVMKFNVVEEFSLNFGPQVGFLLATNDVGIENGNAVDNQRFGGDFQLDYGLEIGIAYDISTDLFLELKYYLGISNISRNLSSLSESKDYNSVIQFSVGYKLF